MFENCSPIRKAVGFAIIVLAAPCPNQARAQFVPGTVISASPSDPQCEDPVDYVLGDYRLGEGSFVIAVAGCPGLHSVAMSPDGKRLRVAAAHWGAILEFDPFGNWEIVIDGSDGVLPQGTWNSIAYDGHGNFYVSGRGNVKVMKFPVDGGAPEPLAFYDNDGVILGDAYSLSVGPGGEVYVADYEALYRISEDGVVPYFDSIPNGAFIYSVLVDYFGYLHAKTGGYWYRYLLGDPASREVFADCDGIGEDICSSSVLALSPDRRRIYTESFDYSTHQHSLLAVDPHDGSQETVMPFYGVSNLAVVPLRGDVDGDTDTDLLDLEWVVACMGGPNVGADPVCDLADMDADGDVELFDARYFMLGYTAFASP